MRADAQPWGAGEKKHVIYVGLSNRSVCLGAYRCTTFPDYNRVLNQNISIQALQPCSPVVRSSLARACLIRR